MSSGLAQLTASGGSWLLGFGQSCSFTPPSTLSCQSKIQGDTGCPSGAFSHTARPLQKPSCLCLPKPGSLAPLSVASRLCLGSPWGPQSTSRQKARCAALTSPCVPALGSHCPVSLLVQCVQRRFRVPCPAFWFTTKKASPAPSSPHLRWKSRFFTWFLTFLSHSPAAQELHGAAGSLCSARSCLPSP